MLLKYVDNSSEPVHVAHGGIPALKSNNLFSKLLKFIFRSQRLLKALVNDPQQASILPLSKIQRQKLHFPSHPSS